LKIGLARAATGDWEVAVTRGLETLRYVAQTFLSAGSGTFQSPVTDSLTLPLRASLVDQNFFGATLIPLSQTRPVVRRIIERAQQLNQ
jgi:hypothetical protein